MMEQDHEWRDAVDDALVQNFRTADEFDTPRDAIRWLIEWEQKLALDPAVSAEARALFVRGAKAALEKAAKAMRSVEPDTEAAGCEATWGDFQQVAEDAIRNIDPEECE